jgi:hypothetical protein
VIPFARCTGPHRSAIFVCICSKSLAARSSVNSSKVGNESIFAKRGNEQVRRLSIFLEHASAEFARSAFPRFASQETLAQVNDRQAVILDLLCPFCVQVIGLNSVESPGCLHFVASIRTNFPSTRLAHLPN